MLIATLPTLVIDNSLKQMEEIISHPLVDAVRYNTGGATPQKPKDILAKIKRITDRYNKTLYVDLEGRQLRIAHWTPFSVGSVTLNRDFRVFPPTKVFVRNAGWFELIAAEPEKRRVFLANGPELGMYYFGESQSVHIIGGNFHVVGGYLGGLDNEYISTARQLGVRHFMLSFVEEENDLTEFYDQFSQKERKNLSVILKIESQKGLEFIKTRKLKHKEHLMAARDDLMISFGDNPVEIICALQKIIQRDAGAVVASKIFQGFQLQGKLLMGDISDVVLLSMMGYRHYMFSDGLAGHFSSAIKAWQDLISMGERERQQIR